MSRLTLLVLLALLMSACSTSPLPNYYVLSANSQTPGPASAAGSQQRSQAQDIIGVGPVTVPEFLQRSRIAYSLSGNNLIVSQFDHWSEPMDKAIARVLSVNLSRLEPNRSTSLFPWRKANKPQLSVQILVRDIDRTSLDQARLDADWSIVAVSTKEILHRGKFSQTALLPGGFTYAALAGAYSDLLAQLSESIDTQLRHYQSVPLE